MDAFARIAEQRISQAISDGAFDDLDGYGKPLRLDDDTFVPGDLKIVYRVLKNAGIAPPELALRKDIMNLRELLETMEDEDGRIRCMRQLNYKLLSYELATGRRPDLAEYEEVYIERLTVGRKT